MDICIRADGGSSIGMGHIMRSLVLAQELEKNHNVFFACRVDNPLSGKYKSGINLVKDNGFKVIKIQEDKLKQEITNIKADCIITDSYDVDEEYFNICKQKFKVNGCLDDEKICEYFNVDFLINQNIYAKDLEYKVNEDTILMLGSEYIILRDEFKNIPYKNIKQKLNKVMITVGGSDNHNITEKIIKNLKDLDCELYVVIGPGFKYIENLKRYEDNKVHLCFNANMSELMKKCDLAIASCGTTLYELSACGIPTIGIVVAENQALAAESMDKLGVIKYSTIKDLHKNLMKFSYDYRKKMSKRMRNIVDGKGIYRIIYNIEKRGESL